MQNPRALLLGSVALLAQAPLAAAGAIDNGTFDTDLAGWSTVVTNGIVAWTSEHVELSTGSGTNLTSAVLVQGDDGAFNFPSPITLATDDAFLRFDALFADLGVDSSENTVSGFSDHLSVLIYDAESFDQWLGGSFSLVTPGGTGLSFDLTAPADLRGKRVAVSFELTDEDDGRNSVVTIDNVRIEQRSAVPDPGTLALMLVGLSGFRPRRKNRGSC